MIARASRGVWVALLLLATVGARADPGPVRLVAEPVDGDPAAGLVQLRAALQARGVPAGRAEVAPERGFEPQRLSALEAVEAHLAVARLARAQLEDARALRELLEARARLEADLALPGISRWLAEVELQLGLVAAQMGREALALQSFARAAALDPTRVLAAAEAPPATLELWQRASAELRQRGLSRFRVESRAGGVVWLDDRPLGPSPRWVEVAPGRHLVAVRAPGHRPYAALVDALPGERPPLRISPAPDPARVPPAPRPRAGEAAPQLAERVRTYSDTYPTAQVWWLRAASAPGESSGLWRCVAGQCRREATLGEPMPQPPAASDPRTERGRARRIAPWVATAVVLAAAVVVAATVRRPDTPASEQVVTLDSGDLLR